jgi:hypothetical protein
MGHQAEDGAQTAIARADGLGSQLNNFTFTPKSFLRDTPATIRMNHWIADC